MKILKNKKGFTLIELLAVIVILAVIILVAVNAVIPQMKKARAGAFQTEVETFLNAAETYYTALQMSNGSFNSEGKDGLNIADLVDNNYVKKSDIGNYNGCIKKSEDAEGKVTFTIKMASKQFKTVKSGTNNYVTASDLSEFSEVNSSSVIQDLGDTAQNSYDCADV